MKCVVPGSYDPVTVGHIDIIKRASLIFDEVYAVAFENCDKRYTFTADFRLEMLAAACSDMKNVKTELSSRMLVDYMREREIGCIVKGIRDAADSDYEYMLANINRSFDPTVETVLLPSRPELQHISSTVVRELIKYGKPLDGYVPAQAIALIKNKKQA